MSEIVIVAATPMFRRYCRCTGDTLRSTDMLRSSRSTSAAPACAMIGTGSYSTSSMMRIQLFR
jgi:hypothetical protein